jgi:hypothetical protein
MPVFAAVTEDIVVFIYGRFHRSVSPTVKQIGKFMLQFLFIIALIDQIILSTLRYMQFPAFHPFSTLIALL